MVLGLGFLASGFQGAKGLEFQFLGAVGEGIFWTFHRNLINVPKTRPESLKP